MTITRTLGAAATAAVLSVLVAGQAPAQSLLSATGLGTPLEPVDARARGLGGLPIGVKDLNEVEGVKTTFGSPIYANNISTKTDLGVRNLEARGALVVGKTNTPEFGAGANTRNPVWGATGNPFDPMLTCGGSSGGSAAAGSSRSASRGSAPPPCSGTTSCEPGA